MEIAPASSACPSTSDPPSPPSPAVDPEHRGLYGQEVVEEPILLVDARPRPAHALQRRRRPDVIDMRVRVDDRGDLGAAELRLDLVEVPARIDDDGAFRAIDDDRAVASQRPGRNVATEITEGI